MQSFSTGFQFRDSNSNNNPSSSKHEFKYLAEFRKLFNVQSGASHVIRDQAGESIKSSLVHTWNLSTRDSSVFPTCGHLIRLVNEISGLGGDSRFIKSELTLQNNWTTSGIFTLTKTLKFGYAVPFNRTSAVPLFDRFQMGGPTSLRGFPVNSLGPRQFSDSLGGTGLIESGLQLSFPLVKSVANFARAHFFVNAGLLTDNETRSSSSSHGGLNPNVSVGGGLMFKMAESTRLELNFSVPILKQFDVECDRGIQIGIGMEFL